MRETYAIFAICCIKLQVLTSVFMCVCVCVCADFLYTGTNYVKPFNCSRASLPTAHLSLPSITYPNTGLCRHETYIVRIYG